MTYSTTNSSNFQYKDYSKTEEILSTVVAKKNSVPIYFDHPPAIHDPNTQNIRIKSCVSVEIRNEYIQNMCQNYYRLPIFLKESESTAA